MFELRHSPFALPRLDTFGKTLGDRQAAKEGLKCHREVHGGEHVPSLRAQRPARRDGLVGLATQHVVLARQRGTQRARGHTFERTGRVRREQRRERICLDARLDRAPTAAPGLSPGLSPGLGGTLPLRIALQDGEQRLHHLDGHHLAFLFERWVQRPSRRRVETAQEVHRWCASIGKVGHQLRQLALHHALQPLSLCGKRRRERGRRGRGHTARRRWCERPVARRGRGA
mmetsp:Transcript_69628/g.194623  ORF Transcript_69628/g.194623 Transcript_69628/m.194623 type:complete len:229 (+) Transcript_69628:879-1565(+)